MFLQISPDLALDVGGLLMKILDSGLTVGILSFIAYALYKDLKEERKKNDDLTDKIITNNIMMQEQLKDIIELLKNRRKNE